MKFVVKVSRKGIMAIPKDIKEISGYKRRRQSRCRGFREFHRSENRQNPKVIGIDPSLAERILLKRRRWDERLERITREAWFLRPA